MSGFFRTSSSRPVGRGRARCFALALLGTCTLLSGAPFAIAAKGAVTHTVVIDGTKYVPESLTVQRGDTILWVNKDPFPHTVTAAGAFDSGSIAADASWSHTPHGTGTYSYTCTFHPNMKAALRVE